MFTTSNISKSFCSKSVLKLFSNNFQKCLFVLLLAHALLMLTFPHVKSQSNIYIANGFRISTNALLRIFSIEFQFIYSAYLI